MLVVKFCIRRFHKSNALEIYQMRFKTIETIIANHKSFRKVKSIILFKDFQFIGSHFQRIMTLDNDIKTSVNLRSDYSDSSINDSVFFNSSISIDVVCLIAVIVVLLLTIGLFLRLSKRIVLLESETVVILRALKRSRVFLEESQC